MDKDLIKEQLEFVEWLKTQGMYNPMESGITMEKMFRVYVDSKKSRDEEIKKAYDYLSACGVPKERAGSLHNGIDVLATRFRKEINLDAGEKAELRAKIKKLRDALEGIGNYAKTSEWHEPGDYTQIYDELIQDARQALKDGE